MIEYDKQKLEEMNKMLEKFKKSSDIIIPNDFYRNAEIVNAKINFQNQSFF